MSLRLAGPARVTIAAVSISLGTLGMLGTAACGSDEPGAERTDPVLDTAADSASSDGTTSDVESELGISETEVAELEQQLDEIDRVLADLEAQLSED